MKIISLISPFAQTTELHLLSLSSVTPALSAILQCNMLQK